jgi:glutathione S-transferase
MAPTVTLYMFTGSGPSMAAALMLEHKAMDVERVHLMVGAHAIGLPARGFAGMTVPAMKVDGRRVQGSRRISRALDELVPEPPLFPADPQRRRAVAYAERWGEDFQDAVRRIVLCAARRDGHGFRSIYRHPRAVGRFAQRVTCPAVVRLAVAGHDATDRAAEEDIAALPARLDRIDAWIDEGRLDGAEPNAADFQIAPALALLLCLDDLRAHVERRPAAGLVERIVPACPGRIGAVLPLRPPARLSTSA